jgi:hypothetical protein
MPIVRPSAVGVHGRPRKPRPVPRLVSSGPNQVWSWDITYPPTSVGGVWLTLPSDRCLEPQGRGLGLGRAGKRTGRR